MNRRKKIAVISLLGVLVTSGALMVRLDMGPLTRSDIPKGNEVAQPRKEENSSQQVDQPTENSNTQADAMNNPKPRSASEREQGKTIVRFASPAARAQFVQENDLQLKDLKAVEQLGVYSIERTGLKPSTGAEVFATKRYRAALTPQDTHYNLQWHLGKVGAPTTWNNTIGTTAPTVAVIDTGFALAHEDLDSKWATNAGETGVASQEGSAPNCTSRALTLSKSCNNLDDDDDGYTDNHTGWDFVTDTNSVQAGEANPTGSGVSHGTLVSGLIAAETNNSQGMSGVSWGSQILPIQALSDDGDGDTLSVALAINYAVGQGAKVINMSLSSDGDDPLVAEQVQLAIDSGVSVVAAAGNDGVGQLGYPANYPGVIAVGASDQSDVRAGFSNYGTNLALVAPGTGAICTTGWTQARPSDYYVCGYNGTSFSSPIVAGAAALLLSQNSSLTPAQVKSALTSTATKVAGMNGQSFASQYGYGRLDVYAALTSVSLASPYSHLLNTHNISLSSLTGRYRPEMNTTCTSYYVGAECQARVIHTNTNQVIEITGDGEPASEVNLYWNAALAGLSPGTWLVQTRVKVADRYSLVREEPLVVSP